MQNAKCEKRKAKCEMRKAKCEIRIRVQRPQGADEGFGGTDEYSRGARGTVSPQRADELMGRPAPCESGLFPVGLRIPLG